MPSCGGAVQTVTFTAAPVNGGTPAYQWKKNGNNVGNNSANYASANLVNGDQVWCEMTSGAACVAGTTVTSNIITITMFDPPVVTVTTTTESSCCNRSGTAMANVSSGTPPYTYRWNNGHTTQLATSLYSGTHKVTVTDTNGCTATARAEVTDQVPGISATFAVTNPTCLGNPGSATVNPAGGQPPYTFRWSNGSTSQTVSNLSASSYTVTVTDAFMCYKTFGVSLVNPMQIAISAIVTNVTCSGGFDGAIHLAVTGGTPAYSFIWNTGATTMDLINIPVGNYSVTVTDANGCTAATTRSVAQSYISISVTCTHVQCNGQNDGTIQLIVSGGAPAYNYLWNIGATTKDLMNVPAGTYSVTVTDANGCTASTSRNIIEPAVFTGSITAQDLSCFGTSDGTAVLYYSGGTSPVSVYWSNGATGRQIYNLSAGMYCATATDAHNCNFNVCATVNEPSQIVIAATATPPQIQAGQSSNLSVTGCSGCTYSWSPPNGLNNSAIQNPVATPAGTTNYVVTATDANGCTASADALVTVGTGLFISGVIRTETGIPIPEASIELTGTINLTQVTMPYPSNGQYSLAAAANGNYTVTPSKNNDIQVTNGISTLDILLMRSHILSSRLLNSPYKIIAADVNASSSVSTADVLLIRSFILGNIRSFPGGTLWTFVSTGFVIANPQLPFPYDKSRSYTNLSSTISNQDFIGIKLGDVNNSWNPAIAKTNAVGEIMFSMNDYYVLPQEEIIVPVKVKSFENIRGYQFTISWDTSVLSLVEVNNNVLHGYYGERHKAEGILTTLWYDEMTKAVTLDDDAVAFELKFKVIGENGSFSPITIGSEITASEAYNENLDLLDIVAANGMVKVGDDSSIVNPQSFSHHLTVIPNPFSNSTHITFTLPQDEKVVLSIYDIFGREVKRIKARYTAGEHHIEWKGDDATGNELSKGLYQLKMAAGGRIQSRKVVMMR